MAGEIEDRIHRALKSHPLERIDHGYRLIHPAQAGVSILRLLPPKPARENKQLVAVAEIVAEYNKSGLPTFHAAGVQRLNAMAVHGAYQLRNGRLRQIAQFSLYADEPAPHLAAQTILNAFGGQLPIGRSTALGTVSPEIMAQQRAHHAMPREWKTPLVEQSLSAATAIFRQHGLPASHSAEALSVEVVLGGDCPSRSIDPGAETAVLQVNLGVPHPIAGIGYLATILLPVPRTPRSGAEICRRLNALELTLSDFVPRLGAWGLHPPDGLPGYSYFIPANEPIAQLHVAMIWWCVRRVQWLRDHYWVGGEGLSLERLRALQ